MTEHGGAASPRPLLYLREEAQEALDGGYSYVSTISPSEVLALIAAQEAPAPEGLRAAIEALPIRVEYEYDHDEQTEYACVDRAAVLALLAPPTPAEPPNPWPIFEDDPTFREGMAKAAAEHERGEFAPVVHRAEARPPEGLDADTANSILRNSGIPLAKWLPNGKAAHLTAEDYAYLAARLSAGATK